MEETYGEEETKYRRAGSEEPQGTHLSRALQALCAAAEILGATEEKNPFLAEEIRARAAEYDPVLAGAPLDVICKTVRRLFGPGPAVPESAALLAQPPPPSPEFPGTEGPMTLGALPAEVLYRIMEEPGALRLGVVSPEMLAISKGVIEGSRNRCRRAAAAAAAALSMEAMCIDADPGVDCRRACEAALAKDPRAFVEALLRGAFALVGVDVDAAEAVTDPQWLPLDPVEPLPEPLEHVRWPLAFQHATVIGKDKYMREIRQVTLRLLMQKEEAEIAAEIAAEADVILPHKVVMIAHIMLHTPVREWEADIEFDIRFETARTYLRSSLKYTATTVERLTGGEEEGSESEEEEEEGGSGVLYIAQGSGTRKHTSWPGLIDAVWKGITITAMVLHGKPLRLEIEFPGWFRIHNVEMPDRNAWVAAARAAFGFIVMPGLRVRTADNRSGVIVLDYENYAQRERNLFSRTYMIEKKRRPMEIKMWAKDAFREAISQKVQPHMPDPLARSGALYFDLPYYLRLAV